MCMNSESVEALHALTSELKETHADRDRWLSIAQEGGWNEMKVTRAEGERIFADRIAAHEAKLKDLGWERKIRVEQSESQRIADHNARIVAQAP